MKKVAKQDVEKMQLDWSTARPNPYAARVQEGMTNLVLISPDLLPFFPDSEAVNDALRLLVKARNKVVKPSVKQARAS